MNERTAPTSSEGWSFVIDEATRILVADDDPILCEFATVYLATPKTEIVTAPNGEEAWDKLQAGQYDIALVDIEMPGIDGFTLVERIRADAKLKHLPVIMVTGREDAVSIDRAYRVGATSFVTKPVNWRQLSHQIRYVVRASRAERDAVVSRDEALDLARRKSNMLSVMRHEFRTPLNAIMGFSKLIATEAHGPVGAADYRDHARHISEAGASLMRLFGDLMALSELSSATPDDLREDTYRIETILRDGVTAGHGTAETITARMIAPPNCEILCDRDQMKRAVGHLLRNALTHGGGSAELLARIEQDGALSISISDRGPGIEESRIEDCFAMFGQGHDALTRSVGGLGLGLPLAHRIAELHGGSLTISRGSTGGTVATLRIAASRTILPQPMKSVA